MKRFYTWVVRRRRLFLIIFPVIFAVCLFTRNLVSVNYNINDYLPKDSPSTVSLSVMQDEFGGDIPNARVMIRDVTIPKALEYKEKIRAVDGVTGVTWLDDAVDITVPLSMLDSDTVESYYKDGAALMSVSIAKESRISAVPLIREIVGDGSAMTGSAVSTSAATTSTVSEVHKIAVFSVLFVFIVLLVTTDSWVEPLLVLCGLGIAVAINVGSNIIFGEISFVTNAAGNILQLAVSLDYSVFLLHRFEECRGSGVDSERAMVEALCKSTTSILASGLTTVIGFLALVLMQFGIGPDLGLALAKGVAISLITVFFFMPSLILTSCKLTDKTRHRCFMPSFKRFGGVIRRISIPMVCVFCVIVVPAYLASNSNDYYYGSSHIFGDDTKTGVDTNDIRNVFGDSDTYVLLVPKGDTAAQSALSEELHGLNHIKSIISYVDTAGAEIPPEYPDESVLSQLESEHYSRMVLSVDVPYEGEDTFSLVERIRNTADKYYPGAYYLAGEGVSTYDLMNTVTVDMVKVNLLAIGAVFLVLLFTMKSLLLPVILVLSIESAIWINLAASYFSGTTCFYISYLIISSVQLGATVDYAILMTDRYRENRRALDKKDAVVQTVSDVTVSILTSGSAMTVCGLLLGYISSNRLLAQLGIFIGRGSICSQIIVMLVLPGALGILDRFVTGKRGPKSKRARKRGKISEAAKAPEIHEILTEESVK